jgi:hypothetical protein
VPDNAAAKPLTILLLIQTITLMLGAIGIAWGIFAVYGAAFPGPCGDNMGPGLGVIECWALDMPVGLILFCTALFIKRGHPLLRKICLYTAPVTIALPFLGSFFLSRWHCG